MKRFLSSLLDLNKKQRSINVFKEGFLFFYISLRCTHHHRPKHGYKPAESLPFLYKSLSQGLFLRLLQQNVFITDILHGAVQLGLDISTALETKETQKQKEYTI